VNANFGDTTWMIWVIGVERDTLDDSLGDILLGFVTVERVFEDIGDSDLVVITTCETRMFSIQNILEKRMNALVSLPLSGRSFPCQAGCFSG